MDADQKDTLLLFAIGNAARGDDGLGWAFASALENNPNFQGDLVLRYQLQVEDAELCRHYPCVIFVDAWKTSESHSIEFRPCLPVPDQSFTTHAVSPQGILQLCLDLYDTCPKAYLLLLRGVTWELGESLSPEGQNSLREGLAFFEDYLKESPVF